jgi:phosphatidate cytidylyltransferase
MLKRVVVALLMLPLLLVLFLPAWVLAVCVSLVSAAAVWELLGVTGIAPKKRLTIYAVVCSANLPAVVYIYEWRLEDGFVLAGALLLLLFAEAVADPKRVTFSHVGMIFAGALVVPLCFSSLISLADYGWEYVFLPLIAAFAGDTCAYFTGMKWGRRKPRFLSVSPKKTLEGCIGGLAGVLIGMAAYGVILQTALDGHPHYPLLLLYGLLGGLAAQLGDLSMSLIKREYNIKDFGRILPGHGGLLDRFDGLLFAAPVIYILNDLWPAI